MSQPLLKDLEELVSANIISAETASQIEHYYQNKKEPASNRFTTALGILGALLAGTGIILVVAHNWDELSKTIQTLFAFIPLLLAQGLCAYTLLKKKEDKAWREGSAILLTLTVASSISLVSQIYQSNGSLDHFLFAWIALCLPLVYIMDTAVVSLLLIALATWHACLVGYGHSYSMGNTPASYLYPAVIITLAPHYFKYLNSAGKSASFHLYNWFLAISFCITLGAFVARDNDVFEWMFVAYMALFGIYYLIGNTFTFKRERLFANPFLIIGALGIITLFLCWSFGWLWEDISDSRKIQIAGHGFHFSIPALALMAGCAVLYIVGQRKIKWEDRDIVGLSPFVFLAGLLLFRNNPNAGLLFFNIWILALSVYYIRKGAALNHLGILNFGLLIFASLAILRFFDDEIPFIWRGLIFLAAGAGFFIANSLILKKRKALAKKTGL